MVDFEIKIRDYETLEYFINLWTSKSNDSFVDTSVTKKPEYTKQLFVFRTAPRGPYGSYIKQISGTNIRKLVGGWRLAKKADEIILPDLINPHFDIIKNKNGEVIYSEMMYRARTTIRGHMSKLQEELKTELPLIPKDETYPGDLLGKEYRNTKKSFYAASKKMGGKKHKILRKHTRKRKEEK